ncbi:CocE/NonD family hydrolase [Streptomyces sp. NPDC005356]|uniref:CocE/NonD family hydrolase n=1 Tax=Streptomyces sp. NPDC005356 TaxID=3157167 RepID=UPI0033B433DD
MIGASYFGNAQWMAALSKPPELKAIAPIVTWVRSGRRTVDAWRRDRARNHRALDPDDGRRRADAPAQHQPRHARRQPRRVRAGSRRTR